MMEYVLLVVYAGLDGSLKVDALLEDTAILPRRLYTSM